MPVSSKMKVGYVVKRYPRYSETFIVNEILAHEAAGLEVHIFSLLPCSDTHFQNTLSKVRASVTYLPRVDKPEQLWQLMKDAAQCCQGWWRVMQQPADASGREIAQAAALSLEIQQRGITHLHAHFATASTTVARIAALASGIPYSFTAHAKDIFHEDNDYDALKQKFTDASSVVTISDFNVDYLCNLTGDKTGKCQRIYNGMDLQRLSHRSPDERQPLILSVGRLVEKKGFSTLIDACYLLHQQEVSFQCLIIGEGELEETLHQQIKALGLEGIVVMEGPRPQNEIMALLTEVALFAAPCIVGNDGNRDGIPTVLLEAMALGTPCISTNVTGIPEIVQNNVTGLLIEQGDARALAVAMHRLLRDKSLRTQLSENARMLLEAEFDIHKNTAALREHFTQPCTNELLRTGEAV